MLRDEAAQLARPRNADIISDIPSLSSNDTEISTSLNELIEEIQMLFTGDLNPVAPKAQKKVLIPTGLNLDEWINPPPAEDSSSSSEDEKPDLFISNSTSNYNSNYTTQTNETKIELSDDEIERIRQARKQEESMNPHYLKSSNKPSHKQYDDDGCEDIPIAEIALEIPLQIHCKLHTLFTYF